MRTEEDVRS